jgi:uncharacterized protein
MIFFLDHDGDLLYYSIQMNDASIPRALYDRVKQKLFNRKAVILIGPRQSGKTTFMRQIIGSLGMKTIELNGDEPDVRRILESPTSTQLRTIIGDAEILFIDEAQRINNIGITLKLLVDNLPEKQLLVTGSSSFELASGTYEALTGRKYEFTLFPFSYEERARHFGVLEETRETERRLIFGSYPEIVASPHNAEELLKEIAGSYLYRDLLSLETIRKPELLQKLVQALALQIGSEVSYQELGELIGADNQTVAKYIDLLEKGFVVFRLPAFSRNLRNELKKSRKIYFYDNGIRNAVLNNFSYPHQRMDIGALWENYAVSERKKYLAFHTIQANSFFWRTTAQQEIDYIEEQAGELFAWECKWNPRKTSKKLSKSFLDAYKPQQTGIITPENIHSFLV